MRFTDKLSLLIAATGMACLCALSGCSDEPENIYGEPVPVVFSPSFAGASEVDASTRVVNDTWTGTEKVGISMVTVSGGNSDLGASAAFTEYTVASKSSDSKKATLETTDTEFYYPFDGANVYFYAFSPYNSYSANSDNEVTYSVADQSSTTGTALLESADFIWTKVGPKNKTSASPVNLQFAHKQSKIIVTVNAGGGVTDLGASTATLSMSEMPYSATYDLSDGSLKSINASGAVTPYKSSVSTSTRVSWEAIVPPHSKSDPEDKSVFTFLFNNTSYTYTVEYNTYAPGYVYTYSLILNSNKLVLQETTVSLWDGGTVSLGGTYALRTNPNTLFYYAAGYTQPLTILYKDPDDTDNTEPEYKISNSKDDSTVGGADWLTIDETEVTKVAVTSSDPWATITLPLKADPVGSDSRTAYIHVTYKDLTVVIEVTQSNVNPLLLKESNCYIVAPGNAISFPTTRAVSYGSPTGSLASATIVWDDNNVIANCFFIDAGKIGVTTHSNHGNAVVAVKDANGDICWSWHIWVTDYNPWQSNNWTNTATNAQGGTFSYTFMDRNLGATEAAVNNTPASYGLFYQWGRKDPFPGRVTGAAGYAARLEFSGIYGSGDPTITPITGNSNAAGLTESIREPTRFYGERDADTKTWLYDNSKYDFWAKEDNTKGIYDPCPEGWRVPVSTSGVVRTDGSSSSWYRSGGTYESLGSGLYRYNGDVDYGFFSTSPYNINLGGNYPSSTGGRCWEASVYHTTKIPVYLNITNRAATFDLSRAFGRNVRCVKDNLIF